MLATDNHIGYMERDPVRGQDSVNTFKEILQLAVKHNVTLYCMWLQLGAHQTISYY
jgi:double-strand break repair protein MRE11